MISKVLEFFRALRAPIPNYFRRRQFFFEFPIKRYSHVKGIPPSNTQGQLSSGYFKRPKSASPLYLDRAQAAADGQRDKSSQHQAKVEQMQKTNTHKHGERTASQFNRNSNNTTRKPSILHKEAPSKGSTFRQASGGTLVNVCALHWLEGKNYGVSVSTENRIGPQDQLYGVHVEPAKEENVINSCQTPQNVECNLSNDCNSCSPNQQLMS